MECDARQQVAAVAEPLPAVAAGNLFGPKGRHGAGARFLESFLDGEETVFAISSMDARDEELLESRRDVVEGRGSSQFDFVVVQFDRGVLALVYVFLTAGRHN